MATRGIHQTIAGVIGTPIDQSKSPYIHNYWFNYYAMNGYYVPLEVSRVNFETVVKALSKMGFRGVNVTIPHKEKAIQIADKVSDNAAVLGAANTLTFSTDGKIYADNTDGYGFIQNIKEIYPNWRANQGSVLVLGAGGGARSIVCALLNEGAPEVYVSNRTIERSQTLKSDLGNRIKLVESIQLEKMLNKIKLLVNTTSLGMIGQPELKFDINKLNPKTLVCDIVYNPLETKLLRDAKKRGCPTVGGLGMLFHQAAQSFYIWYGKKPEVTLPLRKLVLDTFEK